MIDLKENSYKIFTRSDFVFERSSTKSVLALGTFDGVHTAHAALLDETVRLSESLGVAAGAWCFEESPASFLTGKKTPSLSTTAEKISLMLECGLDFIILSKFEFFMDIEAIEFATHLLRDNFGCIGTVSGFNHRFGKGGTGDYSLLKQVFGSDKCILFPHSYCDGETVSSSAIRKHISNGNMEAANKMLGRHFALSAEVVKGKMLGRKMGFPTLNQRFHDGIAIPKFGIYATKCIFSDGNEYMGVSNIGIRPTIDFDDHIPNCETHLIGYSGNAYGKCVKTEFYKLIREERKFSSIDELTEAIKADVISAECYFQDI